MYKLVMIIIIYEYELCFYNFSYYINIFNIMYISIMIIVGR